MWIEPPESDGQESNEPLAVPEDIIALDLLIALRNLKIPSKNCHVSYSGKLAHRWALWLE